MGRTPTSSVCANDCKTPRVLREWRDCEPPPSALSPDARSETDVLACRAKCLDACEPRLLSRYRNVVAEISADLVREGERLVRILAREGGGIHKIATRVHLSESLNARAGGATRHRHFPR